RDVALSAAAGAAGAVGSLRVCTLFRAENDQPARRVVRGDGDRHAVAKDHADAVSAHAARELGEHLVATRNLDAEVAARRDFRDRAFELYVVVSTHSNFGSAIWTSEL